MKLNVMECPTQCIPLIRQIQTFIKYYIFADNNRNNNDTNYYYNNYNNNNSSSCSSNNNNNTTNNFGVSTRTSTTVNTLVLMDRQLHNRIIKANEKI